MKFTFCIISVFILACSNSSDNPLASSDSLSIQFKSIQSGEITKTVTTRDQKAIGKMADFINGASDKEYKCDYDGTLSFYTKGMFVAEVSFNYSQEECRHFLQTKGDALKQVKMSNEAANFLKSLGAGKSWY